MSTGPGARSEILPYLARPDGILHAAAIAAGAGGRVRAPIGCALFLVERADNDSIKSVWAGIVGKNGIKPDTWYTLMHGMPIEATD